MFIKKILKVQVLILLMSTCTLLNAQLRHDNNWLMGYDFTRETPGTEGIRLAFDHDTLQIYDEQWVLEMDRTSCSMSNAQGDLIYSSNGCAIQDRSGQIMMNGEDINPGPSHESSCDGGLNFYIAGRQALLSLPDPNDTLLYYVFHTTIVIVPEPLAVITDALYYSLIDMRGNNGLGEVIEKNQVIISDTIAYGQLTAVRHANGNDWWVVTPQYKNGKFYRFILSSDGIGPILEQQFGIGDDFPGNGQSKFSPDGTKYISYNPFDEFKILDFDRQTGLFSNYRQIFVADEIGITGGCAISPNSRFAYICSRNELNQFDLQAQNIADSKTTVAVYDNFLSPFPTTFFTAQLAPDCKIYLNSTNGVNVLHVIHQPNLKGLDCQVEQHGIQLPHNNGFTMPYFPNYRLGTSYNYTCDGSLVSAHTLNARDLNITIFPNPAKDVLNIKTPPGIEVKSINIYNATGKIEIKQNINSSFRINQINIDNLPNGMYFYNLYNKTGVSTYGSFIKMN